MKPTSRHRLLIIVMISIASHGCLAKGQWAGAKDTYRVTMSLDGVWEMAESKEATPPVVFDHHAPVPGLADMAMAPFEKVGLPDDRRNYFWYRRGFRLEGPVPSLAVLKLRKAAYGARVWINGHDAGEHRPNFTPGYFEITRFLNGGGASNVVTVRLAADPRPLPWTAVKGEDGEKKKYQPGIFDSVELILTRFPFIQNLQVAPDIHGERIRVVAEIASGSESGLPVDLQYRVVEAVSGRVVVRGRAQAVSAPPPNLPSGVSLPVQPTHRADFLVALKGCKLWSPEHPFLYRIELETCADSVATRFGMRELRFDDQQQAWLNGKVYRLKGSNVCIYRFFEDESRAGLPWNRDWVRTLHRRFKEMNWNYLRYCVGFPPELWYEVADEEGIMIQDEFPIWTADPKREQGILADQVAREFAEWMRERWNHPSVVVWDACNESLEPQTGQALRSVRDLDLSGRPWDNGWNVPDRPTDLREWHPYALHVEYYDWGHNTNLFRRQVPEEGLLVSALTPKSIGNPNPEGQPLSANPRMINEYGWLWVTRDGKPTTLTAYLYRLLLGTNATPDQLFDAASYYWAAKTEYWRHQEWMPVAGVVHFCGLGYSRPDGQTSDHFRDIQKLTFEPLFQQRVGDAFKDIGIMIDEFRERIPAGTLPVSIRLVNDRATPFRASVKVTLEHDGKTISQESRRASVTGLGRTILLFEVTIPPLTGEFVLKASYKEDGRPVTSFRRFHIGEAPTLLPRTE